MNTAARVRSPIPAELKPEAITAIIDTREQLPLDLSPLLWMRSTLETGDYSCIGCESIIALERKSLPDLVACVGSERDRFDREIRRLLGYPTRAVVVEAHWSDLEAGQWRGKITPNQAMGSVLGWIAQGVPFLFCGSHEAAGKAVARLLYIAARRRYREARALVGNVLEGPE